jgi:uncharacterized protein
MAGRMPCKLVSWREVHHLARRLSLDILDAGVRPDVIVAIARGGYVPARIVADFLQLGALTSLKLEHYGPGATKHDSVRVVYPLPVDVSGSRVLIVDDLTDTGDTMLAVAEHIDRRYRPAALRTAVLHHKSVSGFTPDFIASRLAHWHWVIYPWAVIEDITELVQRMEGFPLPLDEAAQRLRTEYGIAPAREVLEDVFDLMQRRGAGS